MSTRPAARSVSKSSTLSRSPTKRTARSVSVFRGVPLNDAGEHGYFGLAGTNTTDDQDVIGFLQPQREPFLEYDLTRLVHNLANPKKKVIGLVSGIPIDGDPANQYKPWTVRADQAVLRGQELGLEPEITDDIDVLMIVHPFGLSDKTLYAIDQFVMAAARPWCSSIRSRKKGRAPTRRCGCRPITGRISRSCSRRGAWNTRGTRSLPIWVSPSGAGRGRRAGQAGHHQLRGVAVLPRRPAQARRRDHRPAPGGQRRHGGVRRQGERRRHRFRTADRLDRGVGADGSAEIPVPAQPPPKS